MRHQGGEKRGSETVLTSGQPRDNPGTVIALCPEIREQGKGLLQPRWSGDPSGAPRRPQAALTLLGTATSTATASRVCSSMTRYM